MKDRLEQTEQRIHEIRAELDEVTTQKRREQLEGMLRYYESHKRTFYFFDLMGAKGVY